MTTPTGFDQWIGYILEDEGPEVNISPDEPGGISCYGVSLLALADYNRAMSLPKPVAADVSSMTVNRAETFYAWFLSDLMLDQQTAAVAYRLADITVNIGQVGAAHALCLATGIWPLSDQVTPALCTAAKALDQKQLICALSAVWIGLKYGSGTPVGAGWTHYGHGWTNRRNAAHSRALGLISVPLAANHISLGRAS